MKITAYKKREEEILERVVSLLKKDIEPKRVILFGSRAAGNANEGSDFDIALDHKKIDVRRMRELKEKLDKVTGLHKVDIIFLGSIDREFKNIILEKGKILYERRT